MKQNNQIDTLLSLAFEAEGLLFLLKNRQDAPADLLNLLADKVTRLQAGVMELPYAEPASAPEPAPEAIADAAEMEQEEDAEPFVDTPEPAPVPESPLPPATPAAKTETLDERIARERARDIYKAFTINDKFRYCRELFHGSEADFEETLEVISGMSSFDEAEEYFYDDLCWDPDSDDVKSFMETVKRHF
ncbi:MAG: hypothetical protein NC039_05240 [Muribaculaceae bacterium]|nr:hypothetical protein [Muribaculaceae bacterium]